QEDMVSTIGEVLSALQATIVAKKSDDPDTSYTAKLFSEGKERMAKKLGEEGVEAALAGALGHRQELASEAADILYHLGVLLEANDLGWDDVAEQLSRRAGVSGLDEKASRP
ncbi:MAG: phosphoribosyl-ATP diphosphatase, partial [Pseudomonadota bacterium]